MTKLIKAGSKGFKTYTNNPDKVETKFFKTHSCTPVHSDRIPVTFENKPDKVVLLRLKSVSFTNKLLAD